MATATVKKISRKKVVTYTPEQKQAYKQQMLSEQKQLLDDALSSLSSNWSHWIKYGRNNLRRLTLNNALMIWSQNHEASVVWGAKQWAKKGVTVNEDAQPLRYFAPSGFFVYRDKNGEPLLDDQGKQRRGMYFRVVNGYDITDTDADREKFTERIALEGDEMMDYLSPLEQLARELGYGVEYGDANGGSYIDDRTWNFVIDRNLSGNDLVRELLSCVLEFKGNEMLKDNDGHEKYVVIASAQVMLFGMLGFDVTDALVPSIQGDSKTVEKYMKLVEKLVNDVTEKMEG